MCSYLVALGTPLVVHCHRKDLLAGTPLAGVVGTPLVGVGSRPAEVGTLVGVDTLESML